MLIGGIGSSVSLQKHLKANSRAYAKRNNCHVKLVLPDEKERATIPTVVSSGGVYQASNKANGPERIVQCSYGILRTEPLMAHPEHRFKKVTWSPQDGTPYITNTIFWFLTRVKRSPQSGRMNWIVYTFSMPYQAPLTEGGALRVRYSDGILL
ncbi:hypothetical protein FNYG_07650 [Fusarium nygamai]|uniref:Uncharacterized protein n=1 Tax=Gibberella nygamai TaxID=42673 RepID=A0A2K0W9L1_GIBNY|nr:hypothetical protein FNYG_07650 [Fusarium nygamai]